MKKEFDNWWNKDLFTEDNPYAEGTPAFWSWEGWFAGVNAEREACAKYLDDQNTAMTDKLAAEIRARGQS